MRKLSQNFTTELDEYDWHVELHSMEGAWKNLKDKRTIVFQTQKMYAKKKKNVHIYWSDVLGTLIEIEKFFGTQNLVFQESSDTK